MPPPRPRGSGFTSGVTSARPNQNTPMSERQQMALLIQMTQITPNPATEISRTHLKKNDHKKCDDLEETSSNEKLDLQEVARDKNVSEESNAENKKDVNLEHSSDATSLNVSKRNFSDIDEDEYDDCDDVKKKKRKDSDSAKDAKIISNLRVPGRSEKNSKQTTSKGSPTTSRSSTSLEKDQPESTKSNFNKAFENDTEDDDYKTADTLYSGGLKVPPLKIVIPQQNCSIDTDGNLSRTGKINTSRNAALPYVVSSNNETADRDVSTQSNSPHESPLKISSICTVVDDKNMKLLNEDKNLQRVLRSSHRASGTSLERSSNNSSPQMQSSSPSPASSNTNEVLESKVSFANITTSPSQQSHIYESEPITNLPSPSTSSTSSSKEAHSNIAELHPRKRKIRAKNDDNHLKSSSGNNHNIETATVSNSHPHDLPFTNCFQMYLNIRRQIEHKWRNLYAVKPRPPQGYSDYLMNKKTYLLAGNKKNETITTPKSVSPKMKDFFLIQERERNDLIQRHTVEKEKLCLNVEQEIIRVHSKAARNLSLQPLPYSVCTLLKDEEVYNIITPEQEEKDRNARYRFNGRLLLSWLQDVDDKWEKLKESMVLRHHNEAESLHAVQLMDWEIALKKAGLCDFKSSFNVEKEHVPIVYVCDDFDLLPA